MKRRTLQLILIAACTLTFAVALVACRPYHKTPEDLAAEGFTCEVKFDFMGGFLGDVNDERRQYYEFYEYAKEGSLIVKPGDSEHDSNHYTGEAPPIKAGYTLGGYYRGTKAEDGTVTYGEKWDFSKDKVTESITLYAYWRPNYTLVLHYGFDETEGSGSTMELNVEQSEDGVAAMVGVPTIANHTIVAFYADKASALAKDASKQVTFPRVPSSELTAETPHWDVWADALDGIYKLVRTANDLSFDAWQNVYIMNDIDCEGAALSFPNDTYTGRFIGNNHTVSNFTINRVANVLGDDYLGLFKRIGANAVVRDVTFSNFTLNVKIDSSTFEYVIGMFAARALKGATIENINISGAVVFDSKASRDKLTIKRFIAQMDEGVTLVNCQYENVTLSGYDDFDE